MRFTVAFLILAYLVGGLYVTATKETITPLGQPEFTTEESLWHDVPYVGTIAEYVGKVVDAVKFVANALTWSFKPLTWDLGWAPLNTIFKGVWGILLAFAYFDVSKDLVKVISRVLEAIGNWIPFT